MLRRGKDIAGGASLARLPMTAWKRPLASGVLVLLTLWTLVSLRPIWRTFPDHISPDRGDALFNLYVLKWSARQIRLGLPDLWNANFFYPTPGALAFSDHLLGPAAVLALLAPIVPNAVTGYNLLFFASFLLTGATTCRVARKSGPCAWARWSPGLLWSPGRTALPSRERSASC